MQVESTLDSFHDTFSTIGDKSHREWRHTTKYRITGMLKGSKITIRGAILVKIENIMPENASFQGYFTEVGFKTSEENQLSFFQNSYFFNIL